MKMRSKTGFCNIFNNEKYQTKPDNNRENPTQTVDWNISDCGSISVDEETLPRQKQKCSDHEDENNAAQSKSSLGINSFSCYTPVKSARAQLGLSSRRKPLQIAIKRKSYNTSHDVAARKVLTTRNCRAKTLEPSVTTSSQWNIDHIRRNTQLANEFLNSPETIAEYDPNETLIDWSISSSDSDSTHSSQRIQTQTSTSQKSNPPTELDMFIALIERECNNATKPSQKPLAKGTKKRYRKGGYLQQLERSLESARADRKFLEHDKKFGLQCGTQCRVVQLEAAFGMHMATLEVLGYGREDDNNVLKTEETVGIRCGPLRVILDATIARSVNVGSKLEAFFDDNIAPYICAGEAAVYVQPNKLLLL